MEQRQILRRDALRIFQAALDAADPKLGIEHHVRFDGTHLTAGNRQYDLRRFRRVLVAGAGKASANMAVAIEKTLGERITEGLINTKYGHHAPELRRIELNECGHPVPDSAGVHGARRIAKLAADAAEDDLIIFLLSGGASALLPLPAAGLTLADKQATTGLLLDSGANIHEINTVRKHLSAIKGGQFAAMASPATVLTLILSDVIGDDLDVIGSGVTAPDRTTCADAWQMLARFDLVDRVPVPVRRRLESAPDETPKPGDGLFGRVQNLIVGSNRLALEAAAREAEEIGYAPIILSSLIEGETRDVARVHTAIAKEVLASGHPLRPPACLLTGGETTVAIRGAGKGGRNQEFALAAAIDLEGTAGIVVLSAGTDGTDGPTDAAGALADGTTVERAARDGRAARAFLAQNDSWSFFEPLGDLVKAGPTGTNVMDVRIVLAAAGGA